MLIGHLYFCSIWYTFVQFMTPLHGGAANRLKSMTHPHYFILGRHLTSPVCKEIKYLDLKQSGNDWFAQWLR